MNNKAQSNVLGLIIGLGILLILISLVNIAVVPQEKFDSEQSHLEEVNDDAINIYQSIYDSGSGNEIQEVIFNLGPNYERGFILDSPFPKYKGLEPNGELETISNGNIEISGGSLVGSEYSRITPTKDFSSIQYDTEKINYKIDYQEIDGIENRVIENFVYYKNTSNNNLVISDQKLIRNKKINIAILDGNFSRNSNDKVSLRIRPVSAYNKGIYLKDINSITFNSDLSQSKWDNLLQNEDHVDGVSKLGDEITVDLDSSKIYNVRIFKIKITPYGQSTNVEKPSYNYSITYPNEDFVENSGEDVKVITNTRDKYHNPITGVTGSIEETNSSGTWNIQSSTSNLTSSGKQGIISDIWESNSDKSYPEFDFSCSSNC